MNEERPKMKLGGRVLLLFSRGKGDNDYPAAREWNLDNALSLLCSSFEGFQSMITCKNIVDYGCGLGYQSVAMAKAGANFVLGIDINRKDLSKAKELAKSSGVGNKVEFIEKADEKLDGKFDVAVSQNSMEHFLDPMASLDEMKRLIHQNGKILVTFGCPWCSPYGSHTYFFTKIPWVHILFSERSVISARSHFRDDGATRYEEVEGGLNRMTVAKFERIITTCGMSMQFKRYRCVKRLNFFGSIPFLRELFINRISCVLVF
jgi:SAM-dependent methyltransferase